MIFTKKRSSLQLLLALFVLLLNGCHKAEDPKIKLKKYCPALSINITGYESIQEVGLEKKHRNIYVITYQLESENNAEKYFLKIDTNFEKRYDNNYYIKDLLDRGESFLQAKDNAVGRIFKMKNDSAAIIFNETKHNIILIEYFDK